MENTKIKITFSVFGDNLDNQILTKIIGINPSNMWEKGAIIPNRNNLERKETCWEYQITFLETLYIEEITNLLIDTFSSIKRNLKKYIKINNLQTKIDLVVEIFNNEVPSFFLPLNFISFANYLNAPIDIDVYIL